MAKKIPIRIYKVAGDLAKGGDAIFRPPRPASQYLQGVTTADISSDGYITFAVDTEGGATELVPFSVQDRYGKEPYIIDGPDRYYIREPGIASSVATSYFEFYINPQRLTPDYKKLITEVRTRGGWEVQHWGEALTGLRVEGKSGGLNRIVTRTTDPGKPGQSLQPTETLMDSTAWKRLNELKLLYDEDHMIKNQEALTLLGMNYYDRFYIGYFTDFTGPSADAENPYQVNFAFNFKVQREVSADRL